MTRLTRCHETGLMLCIVNSMMYARGIDSCQIIPIM